MKIMSVVYEFIMSVVYEYIEKLDSNIKLVGWFRRSIETVFQSVQRYGT